MSLLLGIKAKKHAYSCIILEFAKAKFYFN